MDIKRLPVSRSLQNSMSARALRIISNPALASRLFLPFLYAKLEACGSPSGGIYTVAARGKTMPRFSRRSRSKNSRLRLGSWIVHSNILERDKVGSCSVETLHVSHAKMFEEADLPWVRYWVLLSDLVGHQAAFATAPVVQRNNWLGCDANVCWRRTRQEEIEVDRGWR